MNPPIDPVYFAGLFLLGLCCVGLSRKWNQASAGFGIACIFFVLVFGGQPGRVMVLTVAALVALVLVVGAIWNWFDRIRQGSPSDTRP